MSDAFQAVVDEFGHRFEDLGAPFNLGRVYALLNLSDHALSQDDIVAHLGVSQSVVSTILKQMTAAGLATRIRVPGSRKTHYRPPDHLELVMAQSLTRRVTILQGLFERAAALDLPPAVYERIQQNQAFYEHIHAGMRTMLAEWLEADA